MNLARYRKTHTDMFDQKTITSLGYYVYMLVAPRNKQPFYVGKGKGNRVFQHVEDAKNNPGISTDKYDVIRDIINHKLNVEHVIICHGLKDEQDAYRIECVLIDTLNYLGQNLTNAVLGHGSSSSGIMTTNEITNMYNAQPLNSIANDCVIININGQYNRCMGAQGIYNATKECWRMNASRVKKIKYVLSEYRGLIVEVFEVSEWYQKNRPYISGKKSGQTYEGWGFNGKVASDDVRNLYINKSIAHTKKKGQANPVTYNI